jgi:hypothetical protein
MEKINTSLTLKIIILQLYENGPYSGIAAPAPICEE